MVQIYSYFNELSSEQLFAAVSTYFDPNRFYHNIDHITYMLDVYEATKDEHFDKDDRKAYLLRYAILYHDAVYNVDSSENELNSALLFLSDFTKMANANTSKTDALAAALGQLGLAGTSNKTSLGATFTQSERDFVYRMIMTTSDHIGQREFYKGTPDEKYAHYMIDLDLSSLGDFYETFERNNDNLKMEAYEGSSAPSGKIILMEDFLQKLSEEKIFSVLTDLEDQAQSNIEKYFKG